MRAKLVVVAAFLLAVSTASAATVTSVWLRPVELASGPEYSVWDQDVPVAVPIPGSYDLSLIHI